MYKDILNFDDKIVVHIGLHKNNSTAECCRENGDVYVQNTSKVENYIFSYWRTHLAIDYLP